MADSISCIYQDYPRPTGFKSLKTRLYHFFHATPGVKVRTVFRVLQWYKIAGGGNALKIKYLQKYYTRLCDKYSCSLPTSVKIGKGVEFPHNFPLVVHYDSIIGEYCIIHPNVQIGRTRTKNDKTPMIGNCCFLGNGCHIIGDVKIGDFVFISPGAMITKDIPSGSCVGFGLNYILNDKGKEYMKLYLPQEAIDKYYINKNI